MGAQLESIGGKLFIGGAEVVLASQAFGVGQTLQDKLSERAKDVNYLNDTGKPIHVTVKAGEATGYYIFEAFIDDVSIVAFRKGSDTSISYQTLSLMVPNGSTYRVNANPYAWHELR